MPPDQPPAPPAARATPVPGSAADIAAVAPARRLRAWNELLCDTYYPLDVDGLDGEFRTGRLQAEDIGPVRAGFVASDPMLVQRRRGHLARGGGDFVLLPMPLDDPLRLHQRGREALVRPGDLAMVATSDTYIFEQRSTNRHRTLRLPGALLRDRLPCLEDLTAVRFPAGRASTDLFMDYARSFCSHARQMHPQAAAVAVRTLLDLLAMAMADADRLPAGATAVQTAHSQRALRYIEANLADPGLSVARVAAAANVSERYLQQIFSARGQSVSELIRSRRIAAAKRMLAEPQSRGTTIAVIAQRAGFQDPAHFSKAFRSATGMTPKEFRAHAQAGAETGP